MVEIQELTREEGHELFDKVAQREMGMSGEEFLRRWDAGEFHDEDEHPEAVNVSMLIPFGR
jgi:hypothetical protein